MLITLGVQMGKIPKIEISFNVFAASTVRLIGGPVLALLIVPYFGLEGLERSTGILQAAMPAAVLASIIALEYKLLPEFVTTTVLFINALQHSNFDSYSDFYLIQSVMNNLWCAE